MHIINYIPSSACMPNAQDFNPNMLHLITLHPHRHTYLFSSRWIHTSKLSPLLHPADPDLQPHVCVLQVRPKTVLCWGNHHIQRHPPERTLFSSEKWQRWAHWKLHSSQVSCSSCPAGDPQQMDPAEQKLVQNVCGHAPQVNKWPKSHAMTTKIPKILLRQYLVILWFCEEWWPQRVPEKKQKWVACNACM